MVDVHYLTFNSIQSGVGASQVWPYVESLVQTGLRVRLTTFEPSVPTPEHQAQVRSLGVHWQWHPFGPAGPLGGIARVAQLARDVRASDGRVFHARSDIPAATAALASRRPVVWDMRAFFADQRVATGALRRNGVIYWLLRVVARVAASRAVAIVVLADRAKEVLAQRYGQAVADKAMTVPTCADLERFVPTPLPSRPPLVVLFSGTMNAYYDQTTQAAFARELKRRIPTKVVLLGASGHVTRALLDLAECREAVPFDQMPAELAGAHVGLSLCRSDAGISLAAAMPTKIGEFLASGRPVVVNAILGDMAAIIQHHRCGVVVASQSTEAVATAAEELLVLLADPELPARCRAAAEAHFSLHQAAHDLLEVYAAAGVSLRGEDPTA